MTTPSEITVDQMIAFVMGVKPGHTWECSCTRCVNVKAVVAVLRTHAELAADEARYRWLKTRINWDDVAEQSGELTSHYRSWEHRDYRESPPDSEHIDEYIDSAMAEGGTK